jgi:putative hydrolase of the HAD superfamily
MQTLPDTLDCWAFDLDNTLYPASSNLFGLMDVKMGAFICNLMNVDATTARNIQKRYFHDHGTTLAGLMINHDINPRDYLDFVHDIDLSVLEPDPLLARAIDALPGRRIIFTNADADYAGRVLDRLGLGTMFDGIFDICDADYRPKPEASAYATFCARHCVDPTRTVMVEDMARNLRPAKQLGMATIWINNGSEQAGADACTSFIDHEISELAPYLAALTGV